MGPMQPELQSVLQPDSAVARNWRKSRHSFSNGGCVEVTDWRPSGRCQSGECVEVAHRPGVIGVKDSKLGEASPVLKFTPDAWRVFTGSLRAH